MAPKRKTEDDADTSKSPVSYPQPYLPTLPFIIAPG